MSTPTRARNSQVSTEALHQYADDMHRVAYQLASVCTRVQAAATEPASSPVYVGIRDELRSAIGGLIRAGAIGYEALLSCRNAGSLAHQVGEFSLRATELHTSWEWIGFVPVPGKKDPWDFGFRDAAEVVDAVSSDLVRQAGDAVDLASTVRSYAMRDPE